jgi:hypothetical protein
MKHFYIQSISNFNYMIGIVEKNTNGEFINCLTFILNKFKYLFMTGKENEVEHKHKIYVKF